ncbi:MAG TPA: hypothetical protein VG711_04135 [Phycisphaerales bacterium]|nr:hypothetical protein [Phycisphaerales bacterium]
MVSTKLALCACAGLFAGWCGEAQGQWSSNSANNLAVANLGNEQVQPKVRATSDGGCYISWFDNSAGGYDVRIQRLDRLGNEMFAHNGVLVADLSQSSTQDYGLTVDSGNNAVLSFQDTRFGGEKITCAKVTSAGAMPWGATGVQVSVGDGNSPKVAALSDGNYVVAWLEGSTVHRQKLDTNGAAQWTAGGIQEPSGGSTDFISDVQASTRGNVIISWVRNPARFLYTQKYNASGTAMWNSGSPVIVFDGSALQFGYFPPFQSDGVGGAVFSWYETGGTRNVYAQHVDVNGTEVFGHNGTAVATAVAGVIRFSPSSAYNPVTQETFVFWTDSSDPVQNMWGVSGQKFNAAGVRQWTNSAITYVPLNSLQNAFVKTVLNGDGATALFFDQPGSAKVKAMGVNGSGALTWSGGIIDACSTVSGKGRLDAVMSACGETLAVWSDSRSDVNDVYAQNLQAGGQLGINHQGDVNGDGQVNIDDLTSVILGWGPCGAGDCPADIAPAPSATSCGGDGAVNIDDLTQVILNWS